jgi:3-dehydroquinate dehydratase/shikimate dehydrogenase
LQKAGLADMLSVMTYLTVPVAGRTLSQCQEQLKAAGKAGAEVVELRADYLSDLCPQTIDAFIQSAHGISLPVLVTCRDKAQGGEGNWTLKQRTDILVSAVKFGADFMDCEFSNFIHERTQKSVLEVLSQHKKTRLILSAHHFQGPFEDIENLYESILSIYPQAIPKLVFTANHISDCFAALDLLHSKTNDAIVFCMGRAGMVSRILAKKLNSFLTFASLDNSQATAPGQLTIRQIKELYRWDKINSQTEIFGVIGDPVMHSLSPTLFNACFENENINAVHLPFHVQQEKMGFDLFMQGILSRPWLDAGGFSVTLPHKTNALEFAHRYGEYIEPLATTIGAVNTLKIGFNNILSAYNTDYAGAMDALTETLGDGKHVLHNVRVAVIGSGGVARAVVAGLTDAGADITLYNRTVNKAKLLAQEFRCKACGLDELAGLDTSVVINCTSIGMSPNVDASPVPAHIFKPGMTAFDTVYTPLHTRFLQDAQAAGAAIVNGGEMFIRQAMVQYHLFFGKAPDKSTMRKTVFNKLGLNLDDSVK